MYCQHAKVLYLKAALPILHSNPSHASSVIILNALGYVGFKVITTSGDRHEYMWTMERNLDVDITYQVIDQLKR